MLAAALTLCFVLAGLTAIGVLATSYARGLAAFGELRRALVSCEDTVTVSMRVIDHTPARLRIVSSNALRPLPQPAWRAAA